MPNRLENDPRWKRLHDKNWKCPCCEQLHQGLFDLCADKPDYWIGSENIASNNEIIGSDHILTEDFCVMDGNFFIRGILKFPIVGSDNEFFGFGAWSSLSEENFRIFLDSFDEDKQDHLGPWFGWFANNLKGYPETLSLKTDVIPQNNRQRPHFELHDQEHPFAIEQREGITFERILELYAINEHDIRAALSTTFSDHLKNILKHFRR